MRTASLITLNLVLLLLQNGVSIAQLLDKPDTTFRVLSFNILQGGGNAANVGFSNGRFQGSRYDELAAVIKQSQADIVGVQEDTSGDQLLAALGDGWHRGGTIYSKYPLQLLKSGLPTVCRVQLSDQESIVVVNCHWAPYPYGPYDIQKAIQEDAVPRDLTAFRDKIIKGANKTKGSRGYDETSEILRPYIEANERVILTGDFNEPSHLDWTERAAEEGIDRWVKNPTSTPLRFVMPWEGSQQLYKLGLRDAYRTVFPNEVAKPGVTWTPPYKKGTPGRRDYDNNVLDRIDMIYFFGDSLQVKDAAVVGESKEFAEIVFPGDWPSDHRAVVAEFANRSPE